MTLLIDGLSIILLGAGAIFFTVGTVGLIRFPDLYTRLHALTKADNLGFGLIVCGLMLRAETPAAAVKLLLIWIFLLIGSSACGYLIAQAAHRNGIKPWSRS